MKRGAVALKEIEPDIITVDLPDDALLVLFLLAYRNELRSIEEYEELLSMRLVSSQFVRVIDESIVPSIHFLAGEILRHISQRDLLLFIGLEKMAFPEESFREYRQTGYREIFPQLSVEETLGTVHVIPYRNLELSTGLVNLMVLEIVHMVLPVERPFASLARLEVLKLRVFKMEGGDSVVGTVVTLRSLTIEKCRGLTDQCLATLPLLENLELIGTKKRFKSLNMCKGLRELRLRGKQTLPTGLEELTNLTSLSVNLGPRDAAFNNAALLKLPWLRVLDLTANEAITDEAVSQLVNLTTLTLTSDHLITTDSLLHLPSLTSLNLSFREPGLFDFAQLHLFTNLRELYIEHALPSGDDDGVWAAVQEQAPLTGLTCLGLDLNGELGDHYLSQLVNLRCLYLRDNHSATDEGLRTLTRLEVLDLTANKSITNAVLETLVHLRELILTDNRKISFQTVKRLVNLTHLVAIRCNLHHGHVTELRRRGVIVVDEQSVKEIDQWPPHFRLPRDL
jgi:hypothetical protein